MSNTNVEETKETGQGHLPPVSVQDTADEAGRELLQTGDVRKRALECRTLIKEVASSIETNYIQLAQLLYEAWDKNYVAIWGFNSIRDYVEGELGIGYRKARYLIGICEAVAKLDLPWDRVVSIGWTRMREIAGVLTDDNKNRMLDLAESKTAAELQNMVKGLRRGAQIEGLESQELAVFRFVMSREEGQVCNDALERATEIYEAQNVAQAFQQICYDFSMRAEGGPTRMPLEQILAWVKDTYGVELVPSGDGQDMGALLED